MSYRFTKASLLTGTFMAGAMFAAPLHAQTATGADTDEDPAIQAAPASVGAPIVVTGSRIARRNVETAAPIAVIDNEEFQLSGAQNVEEVINTLPQVVPGVTAFSNNPGNGASTLDLRGLGSARTLVLVNGRRWMFFDTAQTVDLNTIPTFLLDSVEVVTGGASAVYGSDAVSGVVNFKLRQDFTGIEGGATYRITERGDGARYSLDLAIGASTDDGRGNVVAYGSYTNRSPIFQGDRAFSEFALQDGTDANGNPSLEPGGSSGVPNTIVDQLGFRIFNDTGGGTRPAVFSGTPNDLYNYAPVNYLQLPQERYLMGGYGSYEVADALEIYSEVSFAQNRVAQELAATPLFQTVNVNVNSAFFNADTQARLAALDTDNDGRASIFVRRRLLEVGPRNSNDERNAFRILAGARGDFSENWSYDGYYSYARTRNSNIQSGNISRSRINQAILTNDAGTACQDPSGGCVPLNIFGSNTISPAAADYISILAQNTDISSVEVVNATVTGLFDNPFGGSEDFGLAFGTEFRKVDSQFIPDTALASGDVAGFNAGLPTEGGYDVKEVFAEVRLPLISDGFVELLELNGAARYSDYSLANVGGVWTYAGGVQFAPVDGIMFRGQYQRAVRAPNVANLFGGRSQGFPGAVDPCSDRGAPENRTATVRQLCIAQGVPAANVFTRPVQPNSQIEGSFGGNPNLSEETADTFTAGVVFQPSFVPGLTITADYFDITVDGFISTFGGGLNNALDLCFNVAQDLNDPVCQVFNGTRNATGGISAPNAPNFFVANTAKFETRGVDLQVDYSTRAPFSVFTDSGEQRVNLFFLGTYTDKYTFTPVAAFPDRANECAGKFGQTCGIQHKYKFTSRLSFIDGPVTTSFRGRFLSEVEDDQIATGTAVSDLAVPFIGDEFYLDLTLSFQANENFTFTAGVNNLFDNKPTRLGDSQEQANTFPSAYDVLGRDYFISGRFTF